MELSVQQVKPPVLGRPREGSPLAASPRYAHLGSCAVTEVCDCHPPGGNSEVFEPS